MTPDMWITLGILVVAIFLFITEWVRVDVVALGVVVTLMITGILTTSEALSGFSTTSVLIIASLFIVGGAVLQTGLAAMIGNRILKIAGTDERRLVPIIMVAVALLSGFMSDTGTVAVLLPAIISVAATAKISPAKLLIPLAYGSLLGGAATLIGTPPNIIVSDLLRESRFDAFEFFDYTPMGLILLAGGVAFMMLFGRRLLPDKQPERPDVQSINTPEQLINIYRLPDNLYRLRVRSRSDLKGRSIAETEAGTQFDVDVVEVLRPASPREVARLGEQRLVLQSNKHEALHPDPETVLEVNDILIVRGQSGDVNKMAGTHMLALQPATNDDQQSLISNEVGVAEILIPPRSTLIDKTLVDVRFGRTYRLSVLAIRQASGEDVTNLKDTPLRNGDTLLVQGQWTDIFALREKRRDFVVLGESGDFTNGAANRTKAPIAMVILLTMLVLMVTGITSVTVASMLGALGMVLSGCLTMDQAYDAIDWKSIVLIAGMWPMSIALTNVGLVDVVANGLIDTLGDLGPLAVMVGLFLLTSVFTQVLSNTATTVIIAPIGLATATTLGVSPYAFMMSVAIAASMAFASPVASPVNTLVMGAGDYSFGDYMKIGVPMIVIMLILSIIFLPILFPF